MSSPTTDRHRIIAAWCAHVSAALGLLAVLGVLCFHFPEQLTSVEIRRLYDEGFVRTLLLAGLVAAFVLGTLAVIAGHARRVALLGLGSAGLALVLGGAGVSFDPITPTPWSLGLDWFVLSLFFSALVFIPIEQALPVRAASPLRPGWRTDLAYYFASHVGVQFVLFAATGSQALAARLIASDTVAAAVQSLPLIVQFVLAVFVADLAQALLHRAYHRLPVLWRFHAVHHSSTHIDWLAGSRMHPVEILLTRSLVLVPVVVLGFAPAVVNAYIVLAGTQAVIAHANLRLGFGWLEHLVVTPRYHHWHHARDPRWSDSNYAIHLPVVDRLLGTHRLPAAGIWPEDYGLHDPREVPAGFLAQLARPFRLLG
jgi:lathosterol oxidase